MAPIFEDRKEDLVKVFEVSGPSEIAYIVNSFLNIMNRNKKIRVYVYSND